VIIPDNIDDAYDLFNQKAAALEEALSATEAEQASGRTGHQAYLHARQLGDDLKEFARLLTERIDKALKTL
jgi:hypothetical protein